MDYKELSQRVDARKAIDNVKTLLLDILKTRAELSDNAVQRACKRLDESVDNAESDSLIRMWRADVAREMAYYKMIEELLTVALNNGAYVDQIIRKAMEDAGYDII